MKLYLFRSSIWLPTYVFLPVYLYTILFVSFMITIWCPPHIQLQVTCQESQKAKQNDGSR